MGLELLTGRYVAQIAGVLNRWDREVILGTLPKICFAAGLTSHMNERRVRIFDYPRVPKPFPDVFLFLPESPLFIRQASSLS